MDGTYLQYLQAAYMILPRMLPLSEVGWAEPQSKNYEQFANGTLLVHLERFDRSGINYRVPTVFDYRDTTLVGDSFTFNLKPAGYIMMR